MEDKRWQLYILRCADDTLYTGIAVDAEKRLEQHEGGKGARYTRGRGPLQMVLCWNDLDKSEALRLEYRIKQLTRAQKEKMLLMSSSDGRKYLNI